VFSELTAMRVPTPWIQAFNQRREMEDEQRSGVVGTSSTTSERMAAGERGKLTSKRMSDSYHSVVSFFLSLDRRTSKVVAPNRFPLILNADLATSSRSVVIGHISQQLRTY
jgi:hypothetical protein